MQKIGLATKSLIVNKDGKILIIHRTETAPFHPLLWDLPGGDINSGSDESPVEAAIRETKEEVNFSINNPRLFDIHSKLFPNGEYWLTVCYLADAPAAEPKLSFEHDEYRWITPDEFSKLESYEKIIQFVESYKKHV